ncbi:hypothetical protein MalM25_14100 [Planctomycetes bacterium MalM25]|nr:hypothetical protein MalM25_14100 [Planctomycetes bacterium MalM25]
MSSAPFVIDPDTEHFSIGSSESATPSPTTPSAPQKFWDRLLSVFDLTTVMRHRDPETTRNYYVTQRPKELAAKMARKPARATIAATEPVEAG